MERSATNWLRLAIFASGDFACNLYWQSVSFYLLFFYTDVLGIGPAMAGAIFMVGSVWDGLADLAVGMLAERSRRGYRWFILAGSAPLAIAFILLYLPPVVGLTTVPSVALILHLAFRTLYAVVNVPFAALSAQISSDSRDRGRIAGLRMLFGTGAAALVAVATNRLVGATNGAKGFVAAAISFALVATIVLMIAARRAPSGAKRPGYRGKPAVRVSLGALARNRAFVTLNLAAGAAAIAGTMLVRSVLYYFRYVVLDPSAGATTLALMGVAGGVAVPGWMFVQERTGARALWLIAAIIGSLVLAAFMLVGPVAPWQAEALLVAAQAAMVGLSLAFWAMLPDTVEYGEYRGGIRVEAMAFGMASFIQKCSIGAGVGALGLAYQRVGYVANGAQSPGTIAAIRAIMLVVPAGALALSAAAMLANPLRRGTHARIVANLADRERGLGA